MIFSVISIHNIYTEFVFILLAATLAGILAIRLKQPLISGYILVGLIIGPSVLNWIHSTDNIHFLSEMGLTLLLFVVGLRLDLHIIRQMGKVAVIAGLAQIIITSLLAFLLAISFGMPVVTSVYIALALTFSSTIIIVKLLSDKKETDSLQGRLALGILIMQDLTVIVAMIVLSAVTTKSAAPIGYLPLMMMAKGAALLLGMWILTFKILPWLLKILSKSTELLVLFGIALALAIAFLSEYLGFGKEVGAFLAGISLASTDYREILGAKLVSLRDFLLIFFFIDLGSKLEINNLGPQLFAAIIFTIFVLAVKPFIISTILSFMKYQKRTGFMTGIYLAQISEFSLILIAAGVKNGHLDKDTTGFITLVTLLSIGFSSHMIQSSQQLYSKISPYLRTKKNVKPLEDTIEVSSDIIIFGIGEYGTNIANNLTKHSRSITGIDFDPQAVTIWKNMEKSALLGDAEDIDFINSISFDNVKWVISTITDPVINTALMKILRNSGYNGNIAITIRNRDEGAELQKISTSLLLVPYEDAAVQASDLIIITEKQIQRENMDKLINSISEHYIVCGFGRMGQQIVKDFRRQGVSYVVIEDNPEQLPRLINENIPHIEGKASQDEVLIKAGISRAKGLIAVASSDEENVFIVLTSRGINKELDIVARSIRAENEDKLKRAGANRVISPYILGGRRMAAAVIKPDIIDFLDLIVHDDKFNTEFAHIKVTHGSTGIGVTLRDIGLWQSCGVTVLAIQKPNDELIANPCPETILCENDELIIMGSLRQIETAQEYLSHGGANAISNNCEAE
jgi:Kef-type K+ transport system membrane component KefB/Trk K+ transport system NAD-binding subunit